MAGSALRRLMAEYKRMEFSMFLCRKLFCWFCDNSVYTPLSVSELTQNPPEGIVAGPITEDNFFEWEALIAYVIVLKYYP